MHSKLARVILGAHLGLTLVVGAVGMFRLGTEAEEACAKEASLASEAILNRARSTRLLPHGVFRTSGRQMLVDFNRRRPSLGARPNFFDHGHHRLPNGLNAPLLI